MGHIHWLVRLVNFRLPDFTIPLGSRPIDACQVRDLARRRTGWADLAILRGVASVLSPPCVCLLYVRGHTMRRRQVIIGMGVALAAPSMLMIR